VIRAALRAVPAGRRDPVALKVMLIVCLVKGEQRGYLQVARGVRSDPPIWLDEHSQRVPTRSCHVPGSKREWPCVATASSI